MGDRIRICHLLSPIRLYGKEKWLIALLKHLDTTTFAPFIATVHEESEYPISRYVSRPGIEFAPIRSSGKLDLRFVKSAAEFIKKNAIDILHSHDYKSDIYAYLIKRSTGVIIVSTPHGWSNELDIKLRSYELIDRYILRHFDHVFPLSRQIRRKLGGLDQKRVTLIKNFIDLSSLPEAAVREPKLISCIGRLTPLKRTRDAIEAMSFIDDEDVRLEIVGDGILRGKLERFARKLGVAGRVTFTGFRDDSVELLARAAVLVIPSLTEGISRVGMEAMALGKPVVGTDIDGLREIVKDGETGCLVPVKKPRAIARAVEKLLGDQKLYASMSRSAVAFIRGNHSAEIMTREYENCYRRLLDKGI